MKLTIERAAFLKALGHVQSVVERRTTIPILSNVLLRAEAGQAGAERDRYGPRDRRARSGPNRARGPDDRAGAHALRHRPQAARRRADRDRERAASATRMVLRSGRSTFTLACLPPEDYPLMASGELPHNFSLSATELRDLDRPHPIRDFDRGDAVLPERHLSPRDQGRRGAGDPRRRHRRAPARPDGNGVARGRRRHAGRHHPAQDRARTAESSSTRARTRCRSG